MLKIVERKSDIKQYLKECTSLKVPCVTVLFYRNSARVIGNYSSVSPDPDEETKDYVYSDIARIIENYKDYVVTYSSSTSIGAYTDINIKLPVAYQFAQELDRLMYHVAGLEYIEPEQQDGYPVVYPIEELEHSVKILCPYCGQVHRHGIRTLGGHAASHCLEPLEGNHGYIIKKKEEKARGQVKKGTSRDLGPPAVLANPEISKV